MKLKIALSILLITISSFGQAILTSPMGARSKGMGRTGFVLSDDEIVLFYNPALWNLFFIRQIIKMEPFG